MHRLQFFPTQASRSSQSEPEAERISAVGRLRESGVLKEVVHRREPSDPDLEEVECDIQGHLDSLKDQFVTLLKGCASGVWYRYARLNRIDVLE